MMKKAIGKSNVINSNLPRRAIVISAEIFEEKQIANEFHNFFINIGPKLANDIVGAVRSFESCVQKANKTIATDPISNNNESKEALF